jgi:hypothetical protein
MLMQTIAVAGIVISAYTAFFAITITAIASMPPSLSGLAVPLGCLAAIVVLVGAFYGAAP